MDSPQAIRRNFDRLLSALCACGGLLRETALRIQTYVKTRTAAKTALTPTLTSLKN